MLNKFCIYLQQFLILNLMIKVVFAITLIILVQSIINGKFPDAIRCGADGSDADGAIFIIHNFQAYGDSKTIHYSQAYALEHRHVYFNADGGYNSGGGYYNCRKGCQNKSLWTLDKQNRTIYYALDSSIRNQTKIDEENAIKDSIAKLKEQSTSKDKQITSLKEEVSELRKRQQSSCANFWDYEQIKQSWMKEFRREIMAEIKEKGLQIGSRWKLQQEQAAFVVRDVEGSRKKDSRFSFAEETFSNFK